MWSCDVMFLHCRTNDNALLLPMNQHVVHECHVEHVGRESIILKITEKAQQARCVWVWLSTVHCYAICSSLSLFSKSNVYMCIHVLGSTWLTSPSHTLTCTHTHSHTHAPSHMAHIALTHTHMYTLTLTPMPPPTHSVSSLNRVYIRFLLSRIQMRSMHYAVDHLDLDAIFPSSSQPTGIDTETSPSIKRCLEELKKSELYSSQQNAITSMLDPVCRQVGRYMYMCRLGSLRRKVGG